MQSIIETQPQPQAATNGHHDRAALNGHHANGTAPTLTPTYLKCDFDTAPDFIRELPHVVASLKPDDDGKLNKVPLNPATLRKAKTNDPATWGTYDTARHCVQAGFAGAAGPVIKQGGGAVVLDLDDAFKPDTGEVTGGAALLIEQFPTLTTRSVSGTGFHLWLAGIHPPAAVAGSCSKTFYYYGQKIEVIQEKFIAETWQPFGETRDVATLQSELETLLSDPELLTDTEWKKRRTAKTQTTAKKKATPLSLPPATDNIHRRYVEGAVKSELDILAATSKGNRHSQLFKSSFKIGQFAGAGVLDRATIERELAATAQAIGEDDPRTIRDGLDAGVLLPREPPAPRITRITANAKPIREATAEEIPAPSMCDDKGNAEFDPAQLLALLHPQWPVLNLATHAAHAQRIRDHLGEVLCYSPNLGWLVYDGRVWQRDDKHATKTAARVATLTQAVRNEGATLYRFAATLAQAGRESDAKAMSKAAAGLLKHTKQIESKAFADGALHFAAGLLAVETERFDQKPWVIGFQNGTWDKGQWREHRREDYLLHLSPVHLDFAADRAEWLATLDRITGGDPDFEQMAQDVCGYILSAASHLRLLPFFYGPKGTGKSTVAELLQTVLGDMAASIDPKKLQDNAARERLGADLWNRRLAVCGEAGSQRLEAELLKTLSGSDRLAVRFLFREAFTAPPRHVLLMITNDPPRMDAYDAALKDRVIALPFVHPLDNGAPLELTGGRRIEAVRQDHETPLARGFAAWAMEGLARVWHSQEIHRAKCAETATAQFWADTDQLTPFWETIEEAELLEGIGKTELRKQYEGWCEAEGARAFNRNQWARACKSHGLEEETDGKKRKWKITQLTQLRTFSNSTREESKVPHGQFENKASCVSCVTEKSEVKRERGEL